MPLRTLIVDDEAPARSRLSRMLEPFVASGQLAGLDQAEDGVEAVEVLSASAYDLAFLDVRMPGLDGFEVLEALPADRRPDVVFTTAYDEYAIRAFQANATDYLLKPIDADRLAESVARAQDRQSRGEDSEDRLADLLDSLDETVATVSQSHDVLERFTVQGHDRLVVVEASQIVAAEVHDGITSLYVLAPGQAAPQRHLVGFTLDALQARLDADAFMRVHRNAIVRLSGIREMIPWFSGRYKLHLAGGHEVTASRARSRDLRDRLSL